VESSGSRSALAGWRRPCFVKQSALLLLLAPALDCSPGLSGQRGRGLAGAGGPGHRAGLLPALATPPTGITTIAATNRAVLKRPPRKGDPIPSAWASLLWYPRLLPQQLGLGSASASGSWAAACRSARRCGSHHKAQAKARANKAWSCQRLGLADRLHAQRLADHDLEPQQRDPRTCPRAALAGVAPGGRLVAGWSSWATRRPGAPRWVAGLLGNRVGAAA